MYVYLAGGCIYGSQDHCVRGTERDSISITNGPQGFREYFEHQSRGCFLLQCLNSARRYHARLQEGLSIWLSIYQGPFSPLEGTQTKDGLCTLLESRLHNPIASSQSTKVSHIYPTERHRRQPMPSNANIRSRAKLEPIAITCISNVPPLPESALAPTKRPDLFPRDRTLTPQHAHVKLSSHRNKHPPFTLTTSACNHFTGVGSARIHSYRS